MTLIGVLLIVVGFVGATIITPMIGLPGFFICMVVMFIGMGIKSIGEKNDLIYSLKTLFKAGTIKGKSLADIEKVIGVHTSVDVANDNNRVYKWDNTLEIICDKNNKCKEVISCIYDYKKGNKDENTK